MAKLGEIIIQIRGVSYNPQDLYDTLNENSIPLLRANNIQNGNIVLADIVYVSKAKVSEKQYLKRGDILICTSSGSKELVGKAAFIEKDMPITFGAFCKVIRPIREYQKYIGYFFQSPYYRRRISELSAGANINNIRNEHIENLEICLPKIEEQQYIAAVLDKVTDLIAQRRAQLDKLDLLVKSRFVEMFGDLMLNSHHLPAVPLGSILTVEPQNGLYKPQSDYVSDGQGIPILRIDSFYGGKVSNLQSLKRLICSDAELKKYSLHENDIVINRVNSIEYLGKCGLIQGLIEDTVFESNMMRLHIDETKFDPIYMTQMLCSEFIHQQIMKRAKKAVNQASINQKDVQSFTVYMPPLEIQKRFAAFVAQVNKSKAFLDTSLKEMKRVKESLMQQYFG